MARPQIEKHLNSDCNSEESYPLIAKLYSQNQRLRNLIVYASKYGYSDWVNLLLLSGWSPHIQDEKPLWEAFRNGHLMVAEVLLKAGADFRRHPQPPLIQAIEQKQIEILQLLVSRGVRFSRGDIHVAIHLGNIQIFKLTLDNRESGEDLLNFLVIATFYNNREVIKYLDNRGIKHPKNDITYYGHTEVQTFQLLLNLGYENEEVIQLIGNPRDPEVREFLLDLEF